MSITDLLVTIDSLTELSYNRSMKTGTKVEVIAGRKALGVVKGETAVVEDVTRLHFGIDVTLKFSGEKTLKLRAKNETALKHDHFITLFDPGPAMNTTFISVKVVS